jgi:hypothetical protein
MSATTLTARQCDRCGARLARHNHSTRCAPCRSRDLRQPPVVPREFWDAPEMRNALATWHMGRVIDAYRYHPWHGQVLKQSVVGNWFGLTQTQLSRILIGADGHGRIPARLDIPRQERSTGRSSPGNAGPPSPRTAGSPLPRLVPADALGFHRATTCQHVNVSARGASTPPSAARAALRVH